MIRKFTFSSFLFAWCLLALPTGVNAQSSNLGIALIGYTFDTVDLGYTLTMNAEVTNLDTLPFSGAINFGLRNDNGIITNSSIFDQPPYSGDTIYIGAHQTVPAIFGVNISPQYFTPGPDVVVVWPICTAPASDSIVFHIVVQDPSGINGPGADLFSYIVMPDKIMLTNSNAGFGFERVRIYDVTGRQVIAMDATNIREIPTGQLPEGVYICQIIANDGLKVNFKFIAR